MICCLCLTKNTSEILEIFDKKGIQLQIADVIKKHFWFSPSKDDPVSDKICYPCWTKVDSFHKFYCFVEEIHKNLVNITQSVNTNTGLASEALPIVLNDLKKEKIFENELNDEKNDDWQLNDHMTVETFESIIDKNDPLTELNLHIKQENHLNGTENESDLTKGSRRSQRKISIKEKIVNDSENDLMPSSSKSKPKRTRTRNRKASLSNTDSDINDDDNVHDILISTKGNSKQRCKKRGPYKKSFKQLEKKDDKRTDDSCSKTLNESEKLELQKKIEEEDKLIAKFIPMVCEICNKNETTYLELKKHFRKEHKTGPGYVVCCYKKLFSRTSLLDHINFHQNPDAFVCNLCNKKFNSKHNLKYHIFYHHESDESKLLSCDGCEKKFVKRSLLNKHRLIHAPPEERHFKCETCQKSYPSKAHLTAHERQVHERQHQVVCDICAKIFSCKKILEKHRLEHNGIVEPKVQCQTCGSWYKNETLLRKHIKRHEEALMELKCDICGKKSKTKGALRDHIRYVHKMEKKFKCSFCDKAFKYEVALKEHMTTHTGGALYVCTFCPKTFNSNANMYTHRRKDHPKEYEELKRQRMAPYLNSDPKTEITTENSSFV